MHRIDSLFIPGGGARSRSGTLPRLRFVADHRAWQGHLQRAHSLADAGDVDGALAAITRALDAGEDSATIAHFARARGNAIYRTANASKERADFLVAIRFLALSDSVRTSPQSRFLLGASALAVSQSAATDAPRQSDCELSRLAST